jgi:predicted transcriptional regulator of viral defense system
MKKVLLIILACLIIVMMIAGVIFVVKNPKSFGDKATTIKNYNSETDKVTITVPKGWINKPYYPGGTGAEITLFPTYKDELIANFKTIKDSANSAQEFSPRNRYVDGLVLTQNNNNLDFIDRTTDTKSNFDKVLVENKTSGNGKYRCLQQKYDNRFWISCFIKLNNSSSAIYHLNTFAKTYDKDLAYFYKVIESTKVPR